MGKEVVPMAKKVVCRLFPEGTEFHDLGEELVREKKNEIEIPSRDYRELEEKASKNQVEIPKLIEQRFFSVADLPSAWTVEPRDEKK